MSVGMTKTVKIIGDHVFAIEEVIRKVGTTQDFLDSLMRGQVSDSGWLPRGTIRVLNWRSGKAYLVEFDKNFPFYVNLSREYAGIQTMTLPRLYKYILVLTSETRIETVLFFMAAKRLKEDEEQELFVPPVPNINSNCAVCLGTLVTSGKTLIEQVESYIEQITRGVWNRDLSDIVHCDWANYFVTRADAFHRKFARRFKDSPRWNRVFPIVEAFVPYKIMKATSKANKGNFDMLRKVRNWDRLIAQFLER